MKLNNSHTQIPIIILSARSRGFMLMRWGMKQTTSVFCTFGKTASCLHMTDARNQPDFTAERWSVRAWSLALQIPAHILLKVQQKKATQNWALCRCMGFVFFQRAFLLFMFFFILRQAGAKMEHIVKARNHQSLPSFKQGLTAVEFPAFVTNG